ncbi:MAG: hypothetical protein M3162_08420 [Thermoproteota archaeon]|nr:hypothetical protein [Thermoproteota archaeon]
MNIVTGAWKKPGFPAKKSGINNIYNSISQYPGLQQDIKKSSIPVKHYAFFPE